MHRKFSGALVLSCRILMRPIARFLISSGMQYGEFIEIAKTAFVSAACDLGMADEPTSAIAARIGVGRKEVARIRDESEVEFAHLARELSLPGAVLTRWHQDPNFVRKNGSPRRISESDFAMLVRYVDKAISAQEMLRELIASRSVDAHQDGTFSPRMRYFIPHGDDPRRILRFGIRVGDLAETLHRNSISADPVIEASAYNPQIAIEHLPVLRQIARIQATSLLQSLDDWLTSHSTDTTNGSVRAGLGVYFFEDSAESTFGRLPHAD